ncbi:hypothetical protein [Allokutzneria oryzae]|uniref:Serine hydrolase n=1 Tax=Allokutzneria oryzae TaxID=1378989 RepID=A0ABV5ZY74_9PSEU
MVVLVSAAVTAVLLTCAALLSAASGASRTDDAFVEVLPAPPGAESQAERTPRPDPKPEPRVSSRANHGPGYLAMQKSLREAAGSSTVSVIVFDREIGAPVFEEDADRGFRSASLVKLMIAIDALDRGTQTPDSARLARMLSLSDDRVASELWTANGGTQIVRRVTARLGLASQPPAREGRWGDTLISPRDVVKIYNYILGTMPDDARNAIMEALRSAPDVAADGFRQDFGIPQAFDGLPRAIKQGWSAGGGAMELHTSGVIGDNDRYVVAVLSRTPGGAQWASGSRMVTEATRVLRPLLPG